LSSAYTVHTDYDEISRELDKLQDVDKDLAQKVSSIVKSLRDLTEKLQPVLEMESHGQYERELWHRYEQLQMDKLLLLDLSHELEFLEESIAGFNKTLSFLIRDAIEELTDHINVIAETHRAHIDILEIQNTRRLNILVLIVSVTISYVTLWEFVAREFVLNLVFPDGLSPVLNYVVLVLTLVPVFVMTSYAWLNREKRQSKTA
jgi:signal transduction histidine kinase